MDFSHRLTAFPLCRRKGTVKKSSEKQLYSYEKTECVCCLLTEGKYKKIRGINNRIVLAIGNALFFSVFEIFLVSMLAFIRVYKWWVALPVFVTTYIPFFLAADLICGKPRRTHKIFLIGLWGTVAVLLAVLIPLGII